VPGWIEEHAGKIGARAERELEALVGISSPSGDVRGAEDCAAICAALLPDGSQIERVPCASPGHAPDLIGTLNGSGRHRLLLLGHVDTVIGHENHQPLTREDGRLKGSGTIDMKGGVILSLGVMRALAQRREDFAEASLMLVCDEEWRTEPFAHVDRFAGYDACLCFEGGEMTADGTEGVVVKRKGAATVQIDATGVASHSGSAPDHGRNALLALAAIAQAVATRHDPTGEHRLTAVPTVMRAGDAFNVVPGHGRLLCDLRADDASAFDTVMAAIPPEHGGVELDARILRIWPGMDSRDATLSLLERASAHLGRTVEGVTRGGASDASHFASAIPITIDGLGPRGGAAHNPQEYVIPESLRTRAEVALAIADALLAGESRQ
jgi:glutamate carboxypeptidase